MTRNETQNKSTANGSTSSDTLPCDLSNVTLASQNTNPYLSNGCAQEKPEFLIKIIINNYFYFVKNKLLRCGLDLKCPSNVSCVWTVTASQRYYILSVD